MSIGVFNERAFNAPDPPRLMELRLVTRVAILATREWNTASTVSISGGKEYDAANVTNVCRERRREYLTIVGVPRSVARNAGVTLSVDRNVTSCSSANIGVQKRVQENFHTIVVLPRPVSLLAPVAVSRAAQRLWDGRACVSVGKSKIVPTDTAANVTRVRRIDFETGVSIPGRFERTVTAVLSVGRWRFHDGATVLIPKRTRSTAADLGVSVERMCSHCFSTDIFVGRRRFRLEDTAVSVGALRSVAATLYARIDRIRRHDTATGIQVDRSWFDTHLIDLLPSVWKERDETGDLAAFLKIPAFTLDEFKNRLDAFSSVFDVDECDPAFLPLLAALLGWSLDPAGHTDTQRRALREAVEFYRRKGTIPAIVRSLENIGWRGRLYETFRGMVRTNRRARLNGLRLAGTVFNQGVYRVESDNIVPAVRKTLAPHHPAGARVFFLQRMDMTEDAGQDTSAGFRQASRRGAFASQHDNFILNQNRANTPFPLTRMITARETVRLTRCVYAQQELTESHGIAERWQRPDGGLALNRGYLNWADLANVDRSALRLSLELDVDVARESGGIVPLVLGNKRLNRSGLQKGSAYRWRFRQREDKQEIQAALESAANEYVIREWPAA